MQPGPPGSKPSEYEIEKLLWTTTSSDWWTVGFFFIDWRKFSSDQFDPLEVARPSNLHPGGFTSALHIQGVPKIWNVL